MVKEGYKEIRVGPQKEIIPENWEVKALSDIGKFINGKGFSSSDWEKQGLPIVRIQNLNDEEAEYNYYSGDVKDRYYLENGDILLSWSASLGAYKWNRGKAILNQHIFKVLPKDNINKEFMYQLLLVTIDKLEQKTHGSTMKHIRRKELDLTYFPLPPLFEQKKIASILSSVDKSIEKTDEVIKETKELKKGLMQELLTKGIGHSEVKESKFGKIPLGWEIKQLGEVTHNHDKNRIPLSSKERQEREGKFPYYGAQGIIDYIDDFIFKGEYLLVAEDGENLKSRKKPLATVVKGEFWANNHTHILSTSKNDIYYLKYIINKVDISGYITGTAQPKLNQKETKLISIPIPPLEEQKKIASILSSVDAKIQKEEEYKSKLEKLKKGLMQKLLTGEIRVNTEMEV